MCVCMYLFIHICVCVYVLINIYIRIIHVCVYIDAYTYIDSQLLFKRESTPLDQYKIHIYIYIYVCMYIYVLYIYVYIYSCVYIHRQSAPLWEESTPLGQNGRANNGNDACREVDS